jgi:hypothetical protein
MLPACAPSKRIGRCGNAGGSTQLSLRQTIDRHLRAVRRTRAASAAGKRQRQQQQQQPDDAAKDSARLNERRAARFNRVLERAENYVAAAELT